MSDKAHKKDYELPSRSLPYLTDSFVCDDEEGVGKFLESSDLPSDKFVFYAIFDQDSQKVRVYGEARVGFEEES